MRSNGTLSYILSDHLGSTSLTTDTSGAVTSELRYNAWGEIRYVNGTPPTGYAYRGYTYTGQYSYVGDFGLMYYNARFYDPYLNHFTQPDSIVPDPSNSQAWDRYAYAFNNPIRYTDPTGHRNCEEDGYHCPGDEKPISPKPPKPSTVFEKALSGDASAIIELLLPTHLGVRGQIEGSIDLGFGLSGTVGANVVYNRIDDRLAGSIDWAIEPGAGIGEGVSGTVGPLVGFLSTKVDDATSGYSGILSGTTAAGGAISVGVVAPLEGTSIENISGLHVDSHYGQVPFTIYLGGGAGGAYAGVGGGLSGTFTQNDLSYFLPWH
jgi:RHS repeat-associated protein